MICTLLSLSLLAPCALPTRGAPQAQGSSPERVEIISFSGYPAGTILDSVHSAGGLGPVQVLGQNPALGEANAAIIFNSAQPTGGDFDLGTPHQDFGGPGIGAGGSAGSPHENKRPLGNLLVVGSDLIDLDGDGLVDDPSDAQVPGALIVLDFAGIGTV